MPDRENALAVGRQTLASVRRSLAERVVDLIGKDPDRLAGAIESGLIRREWLEDPSGGHAMTSAPVEVVERFLRRSVEERPSLLNSLGLTAIEILSSSDGDGARGSSAHLTVVFTDLEGFTRYTSEKGDEAASGLLAEHHRAVGPIVRSRGGRLVKLLGDGTLLTFPEAEAAVLACLELRAQPPAPLRLRAGIHAGEVMVTRDDVIGHVVNVAARVAQSAKGGDVLATEDVCSAIEHLDGVSISRPKRRRFKGLDEAVAVCRVTPA